MKVPNWTWLALGVVVTAAVGNRFNIALLAWVVSVPWLVYLRQTSGWQSRATFFVVGERVVKYPALIADMKAGGHAVAGHGYKHIDHGKLSVSAAFDKQFVPTDDAIAEAFGSHAGYWRPPYGSVNDKQLTYLRERDVRTVLWSVDSLDWSDSFAKKKRIEKRVLAQVHPGAIILLHSGARRTATAEALPAILGTLKMRGYRFATIEQLFELKRQRTHTTAAVTPK